MIPATYTLTIDQGATLLRYWAMVDTDGSVLDLNTLGYTTGRLTVRDAYASEGGEALLELTTDNGGVVIDYDTDSAGTYWSGRIFATAGTTAALTPFGEAVYDLEISNGTTIYRVMQGVCVLSPEVTT